MKEVRHSSRVACLVRARLPVSVSGLSHFYCTSTSTSKMYNAENCHQFAESKHSWNGIRKDIIFDQRTYEDEQPLLLSWIIMCGWNMNINRPQNLLPKVWCGPKPIFKLPVLKNKKKGIGVGPNESRKIPSEMEVAPCYRLLTLITLFTLLTMKTWVT